MVAFTLTLEDEIILFGLMDLAHDEGLTSAAVILIIF